MEIDDAWYHFDAAGWVQTGWLWDAGSWYYLVEETDGTDYHAGWMYTYYRFIDGKLYYFAQDGRMAQNEVLSYAVRAGASEFDEEDRCDFDCFGADGAFVEGWANIPEITLQRSYNYEFVGTTTVSGGWIYQTLTDPDFIYWQQIDGSWYYFQPYSYLGQRIGDPSFESDESRPAYFLMATGWCRPVGESSWYYLGTSGAMQTGWVNDGGTWYWLTESGAMATGWRFIDGKWNAFDNPSGVWRTNDGRLVNGWYTAQAISSPTNWFILVDDINTKVMIYYWDIDQWMLLYIFDCSTGAWSMRTVHGTFSVGMKGYAFGYGHGYTAYYYTQIYGDYLFHSILYNEGTWVPLDPVLNSHRSHGCVRLAPENAKWIYDNIPRGTTVHIF